MSAEQSSRPTLTVECLQSAEAVEQLRAIWQTLERLDPHCTPFNTWTWNSLWWHHYRKAGDTLALLIVRQERRVVAIAPLYIHSSRMCKVIPVRELRFVGSGGGTCADYLDIIALPALRRAAEQAVMHYLPSIPGWQKLLLTGMREGSNLARQASLFVAEHSGVTLAQQHHVLQTAALPDTVEDYRAQLSGEQFEQNDHAQHGLDAAGEARLSICASNEELAEAADALLELHRQCSDHPPEADAFRSVADEQFHRAVIRQFFAADALWLATLTLNEQIIGVEYIFIWRGELLFVHGAYSPEHESLSPGHVLFTHVIQRGIEQGMTGLNLLKGQNPSQSAYARDRTHTVDIGYLRPGIRGLIAATRDRMSRPQNELASRSF